MEAVGGGVRSGILSLALKDLESLYLSYMPFIKNGGIFIPTRKDYVLGDEVFVLLELMDEPEKIPLTGKIVWITPKGSSADRRLGIGIQLAEESAQLVGKIEAYLAALLSQDRPTNTF
ncbi:MAG: PilZ domain-containing protein [Porticoccaceae bacterium]